MEFVYRPYFHPRTMPVIPEIIEPDAAPVVPDIGVAATSQVTSAQAAGVSVAAASPRMEVSGELFVENTTNRAGTANADVTVSCSAIGTRVVAGQQAGMSESGIEHAIERLIEDTP